MSWSESSAQVLFSADALRASSITLADFENFGEQEIAKP
jgi:hypothetical protein